MLGLRLYLVSLHNDNDDNDDNESFIDDDEQVDMDGLELLENTCLLMLFLVRTDAV